MINKTNIEIKYVISRGEIYYADLGSGLGSEQNGLRPVLIVQNDIGNKFSSTTIVAAITSKKNKNKLPTHITISKEESGLSQDSVVLAEQVRTIDKSRLYKKIGCLDDNCMEKINNAICVSFYLNVAESTSKVSK